MIIVLFFIVMFLIGIAMGIVSEKVDPYSDWGATGAGLAILNSLILIICAFMIFSVHFSEDVEIAKDQIKYESLCKRYEIIQSEYEDVSKVEVIKDIAAWNMAVKNQKYWSENLLTNWFYSKKHADSLQYIDISETN